MDLMKRTAGVALLIVLATVVAAPSHAGSPATTVGVVRKDHDGSLLWIIRYKNSAGLSDKRFNYGSGTKDFPMVGDWNDDGKDTAGVVRIVDHDLHWFLRNSNSTGGAHIRPIFGNEGDRPVVGDWNGDGRDTIGAVRKVDGKLQWLLRNDNKSGQAKIRFTYGTAKTDIPVVGDWDGNGTDTPGVVRPNGDEKWLWLLRNSNSDGKSQKQVTYGSTTTRPIAGDWDGDGFTTTGAVLRGTKKLKWYFRNDLKGHFAPIVFEYGTAKTDFPVVGDWNG
jgi:hypothetical protein